MKYTILVIGLAVILVMFGTQQQAKAFPTTDQKYQQVVLKVRFYGFVISCVNELHLSPDNLTMDQAQQCPKAYQDFKDLTGDRIVI